MKRILRSAASTNDAGNGPRIKTMKKSSASSKPQRKRRDIIYKENKENATTIGKKNSQKDAVQPLRQKNSIPLDQKNDKSPMLGSSRAAKPEKLSSIVVDVSKQRTRRKLVDDKKRSEEAVITEPDTTTVDQPPKAPKTFVEVPSVTLRKRKQTKGIRSVPSPAKDAKSQTDQEEKPSSIVVDVSRQRNRRKLVDDKKRTEQKIVTEPDTTAVDQPPSAAPEKSVEVSSVTLRKRKQTKDIGPVLSPAKDAKSQTDQGKSSIKETLATDCPTKDARRDIDEPKKGTKTKTAKVVVPFTVRTRSADKSSRRSYTSVNSLCGTHRQSKQPEIQAKKTPTKRPTVVSTVTTKSDGIAKKARTTKSKSSTRANADSTQFVTIRSNRKEPLKPAAAKNEKPKTKEPTLSNVTMRRRRANSQTITNNSTKEIDTVSDIPRKKRSQSVLRVTNEMETDVMASPPKRRRIAKKEDPKIDGKITKPQQPELLVNRSTASDSSDQSNGSVLPIYKRTDNTNNNTVSSVFDFESNSQENTVNNDEEMQQLLAKMARDKRVSIVKRKGNQKKRGTKAKANVTRSKRIEKIRSELKELQEQKMLSAKVSVPNDRAKRIIPKAHPKSSDIESYKTNTRDNASAVDLVNEVVDVSESSNKSQQNDEVLPDKQRSTAVDDFMDDIVDDIQFDVAPVEDNVSIHKPWKKPVVLKLNTTTTETPPRQFPVTYTGPRKEMALHQSTPVQFVNSGDASPWRLNSDLSKYSSNVFSRYSEFEKSPIKSRDVTKIVPETSSPIKKPRLPLAEKPVSHKVLEIEKPKALANDIHNGFGFFDDDDDDNDEGCLPAVNLSFDTSRGNASPKKPRAQVKSPKKSTEPSKENATTSRSCFKMPQVFNSIREKVELLRNARTSVSSSLPKPRTQTKISTHFGDTPKPSSSRGSKTNVNKNRVEPTRMKKGPSATETTTSYMDKDALSLFETSWLTADDKPHRSYSRMPKRENKRSYDHKSILTDDESEFGDSVVQKRTKRTKPKDDKYQEELRQFEEKLNSDFMDVDKFEMIMEKSVSSSNIV